MQTHSQKKNTTETDKDGAAAVICIAATNRPDVLDPALLRPGRFDRRVPVERPDRVGREQILAVHLQRKGLPLAPGVTAAGLAAMTTGFTGADLANLVNEAALLAGRRNKVRVSRVVVRVRVHAVSVLALCSVRNKSAGTTTIPPQQNKQQNKQQPPFFNETNNNKTNNNRQTLVGPDEFDVAVLRAVAGLEKKRSLLAGLEKAVVARHEAGHALAATAVARLLPGAPEVEKLSIIPRTGGALGFTYAPPKAEDRALLFDREIRGQLVRSLESCGRELCVCVCRQGGRGWAGICVVQQAALTDNLETPSTKHKTQNTRRRNNTTFRRCSWAAAPPSC